MLTTAPETKTTELFADMVAVVLLVALDSLTLIALLVAPAVATDTALPPAKKPPIAVVAEVAVIVADAKRNRTGTTVVADVTLLTIGNTSMPNASLPKAFVPYE